MATEIAVVHNLAAAKPAKAHIPALDGVRGLAILLVLSFHFPMPYAWARGLTSVGWCGVDLFFVLSGYLITGILCSSVHKPHYFRNFYVRRSLRIFPLYYGLLILVLIIMPRFIDPYWLGLEDLHGKAKFFFYYSNYSNVFFGWSPPSLAALWSLAVEEHFYSFWPAIVFFTPRGRLVQMCSAVAILSLLSRLLITAFKLSWLAAYFLTTSRVDTLAVGAIVAILARQNPELVSRWIVPIGYAALGALVSIAIWRKGLFFIDWPVRTIGYSLFALFFASLVWRCGETTGVLSRIFTNRILVSLGKYSYGLYVFHMLILTIVERWAGPRIFPSIGLAVDSPFGVTSLATIWTIALAYLSFHAYERWFLLLKDRLA